MATDPHQPIAQLPIPTPRPDNTGYGGHSTQGLAEAFATQVALAPHRPAVIAGELTLSYADLDARATRLARILVRAGVRAEDRVALMVDRSVQFVQGVLAVVRAGGAYVPIDPGLPPERVRWLLDDVSARVVLVSSRAATGHVGGGHTDVIVVEIDTEEDADDPDVVLPPAASLDQLAYVMYTSGSTGLPKGVAVRHGAVTALALNELWKGDDDEVVLMSSPVAFDASTWEIWATLLNGACLVIAPPGPVEPAALRETIATAGVTRLWLTAGLFSVLVADAPGCFAGIREVWTGGDTVPAAAVRSLLECLPALSIVNGYGPTETTVFASCYRMGSTTPLGSDVPIGEPLSGVDAYVLDGALRQLPPGVTGELYIAGSGLARGYVGRPGFTASRFVADPHGSTGTRMYRSGDLVRRNHHGQLEFVGRVDDQVKVRGFRVEPGEIEVTLERHPDLARCVVIAAGIAAEERRLIAYVVPTGMATPTAEVIRRYAAEHLPSHLVPSAVVVCEALPLTSNGKVDRQELPMPTGDPSGRRSPVSAAQTTLCRLYEEVLGVPDVGLDDDFFALGGHSLLAMRLIGRVEAELGIQLGLADLLAAPAVVDLAERCKAVSGWQMRPDAAFDTVLPLRDRGEARPLFCLPPASGLSWRYAGLLAELPADVPVYGLQARGYRNHGPLPGSVAEIADDYAKIIRRVQPTGPYRLLGWSFGGLVAHAVAVLLESAGETVELLALLDSAPARPEERVELPDADAVAGALLDVLGQGAATHRSEPTSVADVAASLRSHANPMARLLGGATPRLTEIARHFTRLAGEHTPSRLRGGVLFFAAGIGRPEGPLGEERWRPFVAGEVHRHIVACEHHQMVDPAALADIGPWLRRAIHHP
jgi:amino acid adenylation domain-containing protein